MYFWRSRRAWCNRLVAEPPWQPIRAAHRRRNPATPWSGAGTRPPEARDRQAKTRPRAAGAEHLSAQAPAGRPEPRPHTCCGPAWREIQRGRVARSAGGGRWSRRGISNVSASRLRSREPCSAVPIGPPGRGRARSAAAIDRRRNASAAGRAAPARARSAAGAVAQTAFPPENRAPVWRPADRGRIRPRATARRPRCSPPKSWPPSARRTSAGATSTRSAIAPDTRPRSSAISSAAPDRES